MGKKIILNILRILWANVRLDRIKIILDSCFRSWFQDTGPYKVSIAGSGKSTSSQISVRDLCVTLTIGLIARYRGLFIACKIYVKCIESLRHFCSIEIRSNASFLCFAIVTDFGGIPSTERYRVFLCHKGTWQYFDVKERTVSLSDMQYIRVNFGTTDTGDRFFY